MAAAKRSFRVAAFASLAACLHGPRVGPRFAPELVQGPVFVESVAVVESNDDDFAPAVTVRGELVYCVRQNGNADLYRRELAGGPSTRLTFHSTDDLEPAVSPDGEYIAWVSQADDVKGDIWRMRINGSDPERLTGRKTSDHSPVFGAGGTTLFFTSEEQGGGRRVESLVLETGERTVVVDNGWDPAVSTDGTLLLFVRLDEAGQPRIYVRTLEVRTLEVRTLASPEAWPLDEEAGLEGIPRIAQVDGPDGGDVVVFARFVSDDNGDGRADAQDAPSLWAAPLRRLSTDPYAPVQPLTSGEGRELLPAVFGDWLVFTARRRFDLDIVALPSTGMLLPHLSAETLLAAGRSEQSAARRRMALRRLLLLGHEHEAQARYELARGLAEAGAFAQAFNELTLITGVAGVAGPTLRAIAEVEGQRVQTLATLHGTWEAKTPDAQQAVRQAQGWLAEPKGGGSRAGPALWRAQNLLAELKRAQGDRVGALSLWREVVSAARKGEEDAPWPEDIARALDHMGELYADLHDRQAVERVSVQLLRDLPDLADQRFYAARALTRWLGVVGQSVEPLSGLDAILRQYSEIPVVGAHASKMMAELLEAQDQHVQALHQWQHIAARYPEQTEVLGPALLRLAGAAETQGATDTALDTYERVAAQFASDQKLLQLAREGIIRISMAKAETEESEGSLAAAVQSYRRLLRNSEDMVEALRRYIHLSASLGEAEEVAEELGDLVAMQPENKWRRYGHGLALTYLRPLRLDAAEDELEYALRLDPRVAVFHLTLGWIRHQREYVEPGQGWLERADESYGTALELLSGQGARALWAAAQLNRGHALFALGKTDAAFKVYLAREKSQVAFEDTLTEIVFRESFARTAAREGQLDVAIDQARQAEALARDVEGTPRHAPSVSLLAGVLFQAGLFDDALHWFQKAAALASARDDWTRLLPTLRGAALSAMARPVPDDDLALVLLDQVREHVRSGHVPELPAKPLIALFEREIPADPKYVSRAIWGFSGQQEEELALTLSARVYHGRGHIGRTLHFLEERVTVLDAEREASADPDRLRPELLRALYEAGAVALDAGRARVAAGLFARALPLCEADRRADALRLVLDGLARAWAQAPEARSESVREAALLAASQALAAAKNTEESRWFARFLALQFGAQVPNALPPMLPPMLVDDLRLRVQLASLDQHVRESEVFLDYAVLSGDPMLRAHALAALGEPPAQTPPLDTSSYAQVLDLWMWQRRARSEEADATLLRAVNLFEHGQPVVNDHMDRLLEAAIPLLLLQPDGPKRAWRLAERARLLTWRPPVAGTSSVPSLARALSGVPAPAKEIQNALGAHAALVQTFAVGSRRLWALWTATGLQTTLTEAHTALPDEFQAHLRGLTDVDVLYVDNGALWEEVTLGALWPGSPVREDATLVQVLSASHLVAAHASRRLPTGDRVVALEAPAVVDDALGDGPVAVELSRSVDSNLAVVAVPKLSQRERRSLALALLIGGAPAQRLVVRVHKTTASDVANELDTRPEARVSVAGDAWGLFGMTEPGRVDFALERLLALIKEGPPKFKEAQAKSDRTLWQKARETFAALLDTLAFLARPDHAALLQESKHPLAKRLPSILDKTVMDGRKTLVQIYLALDDLPAASAIQRLVVDEYARQGAVAEQAEAWLSLGGALQRSGRHEEAAESFRRCAELGKRKDLTQLVADCTSRLGTELRSQHQIDAAAAAYREASELYGSLNHPHQVYPIRYLGFLLEKARNDYAGALQEYQTALSLARSKLPDVVPGLMLDIARVSRLRGDYAAALSQVEEAERALLPHDLKNRCEAALETARIYWYRGNYRQATSRQQEALRLALDAGDVFRQIQAVSLRGLLAWSQGALAEGERYLSDALVLSRQSGRAEEEAAQLNNLGTLLSDAGRLDEAVAMFQEAMAIDERLESKEGRAYDLRNLATARLRQGQTQEALRALDESLALSREVGIRYNELMGLQARAETLEAQGQDATSDFQEALDLSRAIAVPEVEWKALYGLARASKRAAHLDQAREQFLLAVSVAERLGRSRGGQSIGMSRDDLYADAIRALLDSDDVHTAFSVTERSRARQIQDILAPHSLTYASKAVTAEALSHMLAPGTAVASYYVTRDELVVFVVSSQGVSAHRAPIVRDDLHQAVSELKAALAVFGETDPAADTVSRLVLQPFWAALEGYAHLVIIPHGALFSVPFAMLRVSDGGPPLWERSLLSTAPTAALLHQALTQDRASVDGGVLGVAPHEDLPFSQLEAASVGPRALLGAAATRQALEAARPSALDLAMHLRLDAADPLETALVFAGDSTGLRDLKLRDVFGLSNPPVLVALSACESAAPVASGDEWLSLSTAFLAAGSRQVVATQARVSDLAASVLMKRFFRNRQSDSAASALRDAAMLVRSYFPHPAHWATFVLAGDYR